MFILYHDRIKTIYDAFSERIYRFHNQNKKTKIVEFDLSINDFYASYSEDSIFPTYTSFEPITEEDKMKIINEWLDVCSPIETKKVTSRTVPSVGDIHYEVENNRISAQKIISVHEGNSIFTTSLKRRETRYPIYRWNPNPYLAIDRWEEQEKIAIKYKREGLLIKAKSINF